MGKIWVRCRKCSYVGDNIKFKEWFLRCGIDIDGTGFKFLKFKLEEDKKDDSFINYWYDYEDSIKFVRSLEGKDEWSWLSSDIKKYLRKIKSGEIFFVDKFGWGIKTWLDEIYIASLSRVGERARQHIFESMGFTEDFEGISVKQQIEEYKKNRDKYEKDLKNEEKRLEKQILSSWKRESSSLIIW